MQHCPFCGSASPDWARFCGSCGYLLHAAGGRAVTDLNTAPLPATQEVVDIAVPLIPSGNEQAPLGNMPMVQATPPAGAPMVQGSPLVQGNPPNVQGPPQWRTHPAPPSSRPMQSFPQTVSQVSFPSPSHLPSPPPEASVSHPHHPPTEAHTHRHIRKQTGTHTHPHTHTYTHAHPHTHEAHRSKKQRHPHEKQEDERRYGPLLSTLAFLVESIWDELLVGGGPALGLALFPTSASRVWGVQKFSFSPWQGTPPGRGALAAPEPSVSHLHHSPTEAHTHLHVGRQIGTHTHLHTHTYTHTHSHPHEKPQSKKQHHHPDEKPFAQSVQMAQGTLLARSLTDPYRGTGTGSGGSGTRMSSSPASPPTGSPARLSAWIGAFIVVFLIVGSVMVWGLANNFHFGVPSSSPKPTPTPIVAASSATVSIVPMSTTQQETYTITAITGNPNGAKQQVFAHTVTATTAAVSKTVNATGPGTIPGTHARGTLRVRNPYSGTPRGVDMTYSAGTVFNEDPGKSPNVQMMFDATITVPGNGTSVTVPAEVVQIGTIGNISQIRGWTHYGAYEDPAPLDIDNSTLFTGGADPQTYTVVQQSDIDKAARALISVNTPNAQRAQQTLQGQMQPNERLIGTPQCHPNTSANQSAGNHVSQVTVTVSFTCSGEVYDYGGALKLAQYLLKQHVQQSYPTIPYALVGTITTTMQKASLTDTSSGTVTMTIEASGTWVAQFDTNLEQALARSIAGKTQLQAQAILNAQPGVKTASIQLQGGNSEILPANPAQITFTIQKT